MKSSLNSYDCIIIGAGMSGLGAAIRLSMFDKKVCILEQHSISGGLNSYYKRGKREFDVGLHALTNFAGKGMARKPLTKLLKQLRIPYDKLNLSPQLSSKIQFKSRNLVFDNNIETLTLEVEKKFPNELKGFLKLIQYIGNYDELSLETNFHPAKEIVRAFIKNSLLLEMIFCPLLIYGSAWENDMDFSQFAIMFKSIYLEGFSRPLGGVRTIINLLLERYNSLGGEIRFNSEVLTVENPDSDIKNIILKNGERISSKMIISSAGYPETLSLISDNSREIERPSPKVGNLSFTECIMVIDKKPVEFGEKNTIVFYNHHNEKYIYKRPSTLIDQNSAVVCFPNNFKKDDNSEGIVRVTNIANFGLWNHLSTASYKKEKQKVFENALNTLKICSPNFKGKVIFKDVFTPKTILKYTGHLGGAVYGSPDKTRKGLTPYKKIYICGTDQGFLGIIGATLSGISMANLYGLMEGRANEF